MSQALFDAPVSTGITRHVFPEYVLGLIERCTGPQVPDRRAGDTLLGFWDRHGSGAALRVCELAFGEHAGWWQGAPVTTARFGESNDAYFARVLLGDGG